MNESLSIVMIGSERVGPVISFKKADVIVEWLQDIQHRNPYIASIQEDEDAC